jgi:hypothetical protein
VRTERTRLGQIAISDGISPTQLGLFAGRAALGKAGAAMAFDQFICASGSDLPRTLQELSSDSAFGVTAPGPRDGITRAFIRLRTLMSSNVLSFGKSADNPRSLVTTTSGVAGTPPPIFQS